MGTDLVVMPIPSFDDDLHLLQRVKDFSIKQFIAELGIEALAHRLKRRLTMKLEVEASEGTRTPPVRICSPLRKRSATRP